MNILSFRLRLTFILVKEMTWACITDFLSSYLAEIVLFFYDTADKAKEPVTKLLLYERSCWDLLDRANCSTDNINNKLLQARSSTYLMGYKTCLEIPTLVLGIIFGASSDKIGRRTPMLLVCFGTVVSSILAMIDTVIVGKSYGIPLLISGFVQGSLAPGFLLSVACFGYLADRIGEDDRTKRYNVMEGMCNFLIKNKQKPKKKQFFS